MKSRLGRVYESFMFMILIFMFDWFHRRVGKWQEKTFSQSTPQSILIHLKKEVRELQFGSPSECSDIILLVMHYLYKKNISSMSETIRKFVLNRKRIWGEVNADGYVEHEKNNWYNDSLNELYNEKTPKMLNK